MLAQTFEVPVRGAMSSGIGLKVHFSAPVRASSAKTLPGGVSASTQSLPAQPTIRRSPKTVGGWRRDSGHLSWRVFHWFTSTTPSWPKSAQRLPVSASTEWSLASMVPM